MGNKTLIFAGVIFVGGLIYFNGQVADACTHGNCVHGWSSKNTQAEQNNSRMWFIGFPLFIFLIYLFVNRDTETKSSNKPTNKKNNSEVRILRINFSKPNPQWERVTLKSTEIDKKEKEKIKQGESSPLASLQKRQEESEKIVKEYQEVEESEKIAKEYQELVCSIEERTEDINENKARDAKDIKRKKIMKDSMPF